MTHDFPLINHLASDPTLTISKLKQYYNHKTVSVYDEGWKPKNAFWYSIEDEWYNFVNNNDFEQDKFKYLYSLKMDPIGFKPWSKWKGKHIDKIVVLEDKQDIDEFYDEYSVGDDNMTIDWKRVKDDFSGLHLSVIVTYGALYTWDVVGGAVWDLEGLILDIKLKASLRYN